MNTGLLGILKKRCGIKLALFSTFGKNQYCVPRQNLSQAFRYVASTLILSKTGVWRACSHVNRSSQPRPLSTMPPVNVESSQKVDDVIKNNNVVIFSKSTCPFCKRVKELFHSLNVEVHVEELDRIAGGPEIQDALETKTGQRTVPNVFILGHHIGGCDKTLQLHADGKLLPMLQQSEHSYDYDLLVIGGGSGGLACSKEAAKYGKKVCVCDYVVPSPAGTSWGLGGTCVNVGCIPKKLMHQTALLGEAVHDAKEFGWDIPEKVTHNWKTMIDAIQSYIGSLNWGYKVALREAKVTYLNEFAEFIDNHTLKTKNKKGTEKTVTADKIVLAVGGRPLYPDIPGAKEFGITSDDLFSLAYSPGKTLLIGASYIALECAGFLVGMGFDVTVMVRSIFLRGFDQQMANLIGNYMETKGIKFIKECVPIEVTQVTQGAPGTLKVTGKMNNGDIVSDEYNTVIFAIGRHCCTERIGLESLGLQLNKVNGKVVVNDKEQSNIPNIYAIGDVIDGRQELTPVAIQAGKLLARRLFGGGSVLTDYNQVPTTVFTPLEYGCVGLSEESAISEYGQENLEVYHTNFVPLEWTVPHRPESACYAKIICLKNEKERVIGFHILGPNAGEITQGFAIGLKTGATKADFETLIGIHPTVAEIFTTLSVTKSSGKSAAQKGC